MTATGGTWSTRADGLTLARSFVSDEVGIVTQTFDRMRDWDDALCYSVGSRAAWGRPAVGAEVNTYNGGGDISETGTFLAAVGESVERYSGAYVPTEDLVRGTVTQLRAEGRQTLESHELTYFDPRQFEDPEFYYTPMTDDVELLWSPCRDAASGETVYVPAQYLYLGGTGDSTTIGYCTSSGLAFHCSPAEALLGAAYELVERDAFMQVWYGMLSLPLVDVGSSSTLSLFMRRHCDATGVDITLVDLSAFSHVPTVLGVSRNRATGLAPVAVGAASAATLEDACRSAVLESLQTRNWVKAEQRIGRALDLATVDLPRDIVDFEDHIRLYADPAAANRTDFLTASDEARQVTEDDRLTDTSPQDQWNELVSRLREQGIRLFTLDVTSPDVAEAGGSVMRVFSPDLHPLDVGYRRRYLGTTRLREHAFRAGLRRTPLDPADVNPLPHPFP